MERADNSHLTIKPGNTDMKLKLCGWNREAEDGELLEAVTSYYFCCFDTKRPLRENSFTSNIKMKVRLISNTVFCSST